MESNNMKAMREAVEKMAQAAAEIMERVRHKDGLAFNTANYIIGVAKTALAEPPRNCDVGTAEEQAKRLNEWCNGRHCVNCQFKGGWPDECKLRWAQMPYEEGGAK